MLRDLNTDLHAAKDDARTLLVCSALELVGVAFLEPCSLPTWRTKCYGHIMCNPEFASRTAGADPAHQHWSCYHVRYDVQCAHGVDDALVSSESLVCGKVHKSKGSCYSGRPAEMIVPDQTRVDALVASVPRAASHAAALELLHSSFVPQASRPRSSLAYFDGPHVKQLCRMRSCAYDPNECKLLSYAILKERAAAKEGWKRQLISRAAAGDWRARKHRMVRRALLSTLMPLVLAYGGDQTFAAGAAFRHKFALASLPDDLYAPVNDMVDEEPAFTAESVRAVVRTLKPGKTTGSSRMIAELLQAVAQAPGGEALFTDLVNSVWQHPALLSAQNLFVGWVVLVPKVAVVREIAQLRPLVSVETMIKFLAKLASSGCIPLGPFLHAASEQSVRSRPAMLFFWPSASPRKQHCCAVLACLLNLMFVLRMIPFAYQR